MGHLQTGKQIKMSDFQNSGDSQISKLDSALARIDRVIDSVSRKLVRVESATRLAGIVVAGGGFRRTVLV